MQPRILVLLAAYNGMRWMAEQVDSILGQVGVSVSILISVDSSSDGTEEWVDQLCQRDSRVKSQAQVAYDHLFEAAGPGCTYVFCRRLFAELQQHINSRFAQVQGVTL